jgi:hypothetical protein
MARPGLAGSHPHHAHACLSISCCISCCRRLTHAPTHPTGERPTHLRVEPSGGSRGNDQVWLDREDGEVGRERGGHGAHVAHVVDRALACAFESMGARVRGWLCVGRGQPRRSLAPPAPMRAVLHKRSAASQLLSFSASQLLSCSASSQLLSSSVECVPFHTTWTFRSPWLPE